MKFCPGVVPQQHVLDIRERERPLQQRVVVQINLAHGQIIGRPPVGIDFTEHFGGERIGLQGLVLLGSGKAENTADHFCDDPFFVRVHDANRHGARRRGNHGLAGCVSL